MIVFINVRIFSIYNDVASVHLMDHHNMSCLTRSAASNSGKYDREIKTRISFTERSYFCSVICLLLLALLSQHSFQIFKTKLQLEIVHLQLTLDKYMVQENSAKSKMISHICKVNNNNGASHRDGEKGGDAEKGMSEH